MKPITLHYDSQNLTTALEKDGEPFSLKCLGTGEGHSIDEWKTEFFPQLVIMFNLDDGDECKIVFFGDDESYAELTGELQNYAGKNTGIQFELEREVLQCCNCGMKLEPNWKLCPECGTSTGAPKCGNCGMELEPQWKLCPECGISVDASPIPEPVKTDTSEKTVEDYLDIAKELFDREDFNSAIRELDEGINKFPSVAELFRERARTYNRIEECDKALDDINKAIYIEPCDAESYDIRAYVFQMKTELNQALLVNNKAIELNNSKSLYFFSRACTYFLQGKYEKAIIDFNKAIELDNSKAIFYHNRGSTFNNLQKYEIAIIDYSKAIELDPNFFYSYIERGNSKYKLGDIKGVEEDYNKAISLNPNLDRSNSDLFKYQKN